MPITLEQVQSAHDVLITLIPEGFRPKVAIIGGSGLVALEKAIDAYEGIVTEVGYAKIPGFAISTGKFSHFCLRISLNKRQSLVMPESFCLAPLGRARHLLC